MSKLQDRLRKMAASQRHDDWPDAIILCREVADLLDEAEGALRDFARMYDMTPHGALVQPRSSLSIETVRTLRSVLAKLEGGK